MATMIDLYDISCIFTSQLAPTCYSPSHPNPCKLNVLYCIVLSTCLPPQCRPAPGAPGPSCPPAGLTGHHQTGPHSLTGPGRSVQEQGWATWRGTCLQGNSKAWQCPINGVTVENADAGLAVYMHRMQMLHFPSLIGCCCCHNMGHAASVPPPSVCWTRVCATLRATDPNQPQDSQCTLGFMLSSVQA